MYKFIGCTFIALGMTSIACTSVPQSRRNPASEIGFQYVLNSLEYLPDFEVQVSTLIPDGNAILQAINANKGRFSKEHRVDVTVELQLCLNTNVNVDRVDGKTDCKTVEEGSFEIRSGNAYDLSFPVKQENSFHKLRGLSILATLLDMGMSPEDAGRSVLRVRTYWERDKHYLGHVDYLISDMTLAKQKLTSSNKIMSHEFKVSLSKVKHLISTENPDLDPIPSYDRLLSSPKMIAMFNAVSLNNEAPDKDSSLAEIKVRHLLPVVACYLRDHRENFEIDSKFGLDTQKPWNTLLSRKADEPKIANRDARTLIKEIVTRCNLPSPSDEVSRFRAGLNLLYGHILVLASYVDQSNGLNSGQADSVKGGPLTAPSRDQENSSLTQQERYFQRLNQQENIKALMSIGESGLSAMGALRKAVDRHLK